MAGLLYYALRTRSTQECPKMVLVDLRRSMLGNPGTTPDSPLTVKLVYDPCLFLSATGDLTKKSLRHFALYAWINFCLAAFQVLLRSCLGGYQVEIIQTKPS